MSHLTLLILPAAALVARCAPGVFEPPMPPVEGTPPPEPVEVPAPPPPAGPPGPEPRYDPRANTLLWGDDFEREPDLLGSLLGDVTKLLAGYTLLNAPFLRVDLDGGVDGSSAVRVDWEPRAGCQDDSRVIEHAWSPPTPELYFTFSVRYVRGFVFDWLGRGPCDGNAKKLFFLWARTGSRFDVIAENHVLGVGSDRDHPLFAQNLGRAVTVEELADGAWHRFTFHVRMSSTPTARDGVIMGWIDGAQKWSIAGIPTFNADGYYTFKTPTTFNRGSPVSQREWLDDLALWR